MTDKTGMRRCKLVQVAEKDSSLVASVYLRTVSCHDIKHSLEWQRRKLHSKSVEYFLLNFLFVRGVN